MPSCEDRMSDALAVALQKCQPHPAWWLVLATGAGLLGSAGAVLLSPSPAAGVIVMGNGGAADAGAGGGVGAGLDVVVESTGAGAVDVSLFIIV